MASLRGAASRPGRLCGRRSFRKIRSRPLQGRHRAGRDLGPGYRQRRAGDSDRPRRSRGGDPRSAARTDPRGSVPGSARLGGWGGNLVYAARGDRSDPRLAAERSVADRTARRRLGGHCVRGVMVPLQARATADRPGISLGGDDARLPRLIAARLSANRGAAARDPRRFLALHVAVLCRRAGRSPRKTQARRSGAYHDNHVLRHPRVHQPSEKLDAETLTHFMNSFLSPMTEIITERKGTIDKYIGDCIMAFWNAPLDDPD